MRDLQCTIWVSIGCRWSIAVHCKELKFQKFNFIIERNENQEGEWDWPGGRKDNKLAELPF